MTGDRISIRCDQDDDGQYVAYVDFGGCIRAFIESTPEDAVAEANKWLGDLRDAMDKTWIYNARVA